jgi:ribonuclease HI
LDWGRGGPVYAAIRAVEYVGWQWLNAITIRTHTGEILRLHEGSPAMLKQLYRQRWVQVQSSEAMQPRLVKFEEVGSLPDLLKDGFDIGPLRQVLHSKGKAGRLSLNEKRQLLGYFAQTTDKRLVGKVCEKCGMADSQNHRLSHCPSPDVAELKNEKPISKAAKAFSKWLAEPQRDELQARTWLPVKAAHGRPLEEIHVAFPGTQAFKFDQDKPIYSDGSCFHPTEINLAIAGAALVQLDEQGETCKSLQVTLPQGLPQTAAFAEHVAANLAFTYTSGPFELITDCQSVVASASGGHDAATGWSKPMAGLWLRARFKDITATKVKAHLTLAQAELIGHGAHHRGNEVVDVLAKEAATLHKAQVDRADKQALFLKGWREHYLHVAKLLGMWHGKQAITKHRKAVENKNVELAPHNIAWIPRFRVWQCQDCLITHKSRVAFKKHGCKAFSEKTHRIVQAFGRNGPQSMVLQVHQRAGHAGLLLGVWVLRAAQGHGAQPTMHRQDRQQQGPANEVGPQWKAPCHQGQFGKTLEVPNVAWGRGGGAAMQHPAQPFGNVPGIQPGLPHEGPHCHPQGKRHHP